MQHEISLTPGQKLALEMDMVDVGDFIDNWIGSRLDIAASDIRNADWYGDAVAATIADGSDGTDPFAVVLKARSLGMFETAQERSDRLAQEAQDGPSLEPSPEQVITNRVNAHAIALKVGAVNALRTDGGDPFPATPEAVVAIRARYTDRLNELTAKQLVGETLTDDERGEVGRIRQGFAYTNAVDAAADTIIAAGDPADPIADDTRWPTPPAQ